MQTRFIFITKRPIILQLCFIQKFCLSKKIASPILLFGFCKHRSRTSRTLSRKCPARESLFFWQKLKGIRPCKVRGGSNGKCIKIIGRNAWFSSFGFFSSGPAQVYRYLFVRKVCQNVVFFFLNFVWSASRKVWSRCIAIRRLQFDMRAQAQRHLILRFREWCAQLPAKMKTSRTIAEYSDRPNTWIITEIKFNWVN